MIPRYVHRIWLGPADPPVEHDYTEQWQATNPEFELLTWTDDKVRDELPLVCQDIYDQAPTYVHRADIVLVEAVHALGGVSVGYDMEPLRPIAPFCDQADAWCTPDADGFPGQAFFGAIPGHRAMADLLDRLPKRIAERGWEQPHISTGPYLWGDVFGRFGEQAADRGLSIFGDWKVAYPVRYWEKHLFDDPRRYAQRTRKSLVVHRFAGSWLRNGGEDVKVR